MNMRQAYISSLNESFDKAIRAVQEIIDRSGCRISDEAEDILRELIDLQDEVIEVAI